MRIGFYLNPVARLREQHPSGLPDPAIAAGVAESAGTQVILAGWVPTSGSLTERDLLLIRELVRSDLIIVAPMRNELIDSILKFNPDGIILVDEYWDGIKPGKPIQVDPDGDNVASVASLLKSAGIPAGVLIEPNPLTVKTIARIGIPNVVLDCSTYATARTERDAGHALDRITDAAMAASKYGMVISAGRGLTSVNVNPVANVPYLEELYFGQSAVARALLVGLDSAVRELVASARHIRNKH